MHKKCQILFFVLVLLAAPFRVIAQEKDLGMWISAGLEKKITPRWSVTLTEEVRMNENITEVGQVNSEIGATYKAWKRWKIGVTYRIARQRRVDDSYRTRQRFYADITFREKIRPVIFMLRVRYQSGYHDIIDSGSRLDSPDHLNLKLTLKYDLNKKFEPYLSSEFFFRLDQIRYHSFDQLRVTAGITYAINRMHELDLYYRINREFNVNRPETSFIIGVGYVFVF